MCTIYFILSGEHSNMIALSCCVCVSIGWVTRLECLCHPYVCLDVCTKVSGPAQHLLAELTAHKTKAAAAHEQLSQAQAQLRSQSTFWQQKLQQQHTEHTRHAQQWQHELRQSQHAEKVAQQQRHELQEQAQSLRMQNAQLQQQLHRQEQTHGAATHAAFGRALAGTRQATHEIVNVQLRELRDVVQHQATYIRELENTRASALALAAQRQDVVAHLREDAARAATQAQTYKAQLAAMEHTADRQRDEYEKMLTESNRNADAVAASASAARSDNLRLTGLVDHYKHQLATISHETTRVLQLKQDEDARMHSGLSNLHEAHDMVARLEEFSQWQNDTVATIVSSTRRIVSSGRGATQP
eukprot:m.47322 g.47322  ORF g.47322 m.47322 type:complete len:357 (+) comp15212_c0_seq4:71-1141(+)